MPGNPSPAHQATGVPVDADLDWSDCTDTDSYDVYLGTSSSPAYYGNTSSSSYSLPALQYSTKYYWEVVAKNDCGSSTSGPVWEFTTVPYGAPNRPTNICPLPGSTGVSLTPTLMSSDFSDPDAGDTHAASQWQIRASTGDYSDPVWDSGRDTDNLTCISVPPGELDYNTTYYFQVRHEDNHGNWSSYSSETFFTTHRAPRQPSNVSPADGATGVSLAPTLRSSAFSDPDGDIHAASQWQIRTATGDYSSPVYDSGASTKLTQITIPSGELSYSSTYYWRVRHQDHLGGFSDYSPETSFTTVTALPLQADFTAEETAMVVGQSVQFTSLSSGGVAPLSYQWDFDDNGTWDSTIESPSYAYPAAGTYTVVLKVTDSAANTDTETKVDYVTVTVAPPANQPPDQPGNISPADGAADVSLTPILESSAFSDPDAGNTHAASQWQITVTSGDYTSPAFDSGRDSSNLTTISVPSATLDYETIYYWRVRHQDNHGAWSDWSQETHFVTQTILDAAKTELHQAQTAIAACMADAGADQLDAVVIAWDGSPGHVLADSGNYDAADYLDGAFNGLYDVDLHGEITNGDPNDWGSSIVWDMGFKNWVLAPNNPPNQPSNTSPADGATDVSLTPILESSAFSDPDAGDTHAASQWQITVTSGDYTSPAFDSGRDTSNLSQIAVPSGELSYDTTYYWMVRHEDNQGAWSSWSVETRFTTEEEAEGLPFWIWIAVGVGGAIILAVGIIWGRRRGRIIMNKALRSVFYT
jgi:PKD repeat protein